MSKKLNILPGTGFFLKNSAAGKENLCSVIASHTSRLGEGEDERDFPPKRSGGIRPGKRWTTGPRGRCRRSSTGVSRSQPAPSFAAILFEGSLPFQRLAPGNHSGSREKKPVRWSDVPCGEKAPSPTRRRGIPGALEGDGEQEEISRYTRRPARPRRRETTAKRRGGLVVYEETGARYPGQLGDRMSMERRPPPPPVPWRAGGAGVRIACTRGDSDRTDHPATPTRTGGNIHVLGLHRNSFRQIARASRSATNAPHQKERHQVRGVRVRPDQ